MNIQHCNLNADVNAEMM